MAVIDVDEKLCKGCDICISFCSRGVFKKSEKPDEKGVCFPLPKNAKKCLSCGLCMLLCPDFAIAITEKDTKSRN